MPPEVPYSNFNFLVEIDDVEIGGFCHVSGLESAIGGDAPRPGRGEARFGRLLLRRGFDDRRDLWQWYLRATRGRDDPRNLLIQVLDGDRRPVVRIAVRAARPRRWRLSALDALAPEVLVEEIELEPERFDIE